MADLEKENTALRKEIASLYAEIGTLKRRLIAAKNLTSWGYIRALPKQEAPEAKKRPDAL